MNIKKVLAQELCGVLGVEPIYVDDLDDDLGHKGEQIARCFTTIIGMLKNDTYVNNLPINLLANDVWSIVGNNLCLTAVHPGVQSLSFVVVKKELLTAAVLIPLNFVEMCKEQPYHQFGGVVFVGSQVVDFYNEKLEHSPYRAQAYEVEYILAIQRRYADFVPDDYQQDILKKWPNGLSSLPEEFRYIPKLTPPPR
jgi:hypothetical protein